MFELHGMPGFGMILTLDIKWGVSKILCYFFAEYLR